MLTRSAHILLARMTSSRLPGKPLMPLGGEPMLALTIRRLRHCTHVSDIILATTTNAEDDPLALFAEEMGIPVFRGQEEDVAGRCLACARQHRLDWFVRICGDSPFIDPAVVDRVCEAYEEEQPDVATNVFPRSYPVGCSAEAVSTVALQRLCITTKDLRYLEHVTAYFYEHDESFQIVNVDAGTQRYENASIAIDTPEDYERAKWVYDHLTDPETASVAEVFDTARRWGGKR